MTRFPSDKVPRDMWICCSCKGGNLIALAKEKCPVCQHTRDTNCTGPNQPYPENTLFPEISTAATTDGFDLHSNSFTQQFNNIKPQMNQCIKFEYDDQNGNWYMTSSLYGHDFSPVPANYASSGGFITHGGAGSPAPGSWTCGNCGASNSDLTPDFCPDCGVRR